MIDYKGLKALQAVIQTQNYQHAADKLFITQSAVTQRIKNTESYFGQPLLIRSLPYTATPLGEKLLGLLRQTELLEQNLMQDIAEEKALEKISIALNRDSLETWFLQAQAELPIFNQIQCDVLSDDQEITIDYLKQGLVNACLSTQCKSLPGCTCDYLGSMDYYLVASPAFIKQHFKKRCNQSLIQAPALIFDNKDKVHHRYLEINFGIANEPLYTFTMPSVHGFKQSALLGLGYGLIPKIDIKEELKSGKLINLYPKKPWPMHLYWHYWQIQTPYYKDFNQAIINYASQALK